MEIVEFPAEGGAVVRVQADPAAEAWSGVVTRGGAEERFQAAQCTFEAALDPIRSVAQGVVDRLGSVERPPDEARVEFGLELTAKAGAILTAGGTATLKLTLTWRTPASGDGEPSR